MTSGQSVPAVERLVSLTAALLHRRMTKEEILTQVGGYQTGRSRDATARMFERDKELLRDQGVPLIAKADAADGQTVRYWIDDSAWSTGDLKPTPIQIALLSLAVEATTPAGRHLPGRALTKLRALSPMSIVEADVALTTSLDLSDPEDSFDTLASAIEHGQRVTFSYLSARGKVTTRTVEPWRLVRHQGGWYLIARDCEADERRVFRLSRFQSEAAVTGDPGVFTVPDDVDMRIGPETGDETLARLTIAPGTAMLLRQRGTKVGQVGDDDVISIGTDNLGELTQQVASYGGDVIPLEPEELVVDVKRYWEQAARYAK
ncbi:hypothetical protein BSZ39_04795 [Bowdeniella nasicola]|uniref:Uncharacterized protein n=1 Tax=Bowdeniella nasicola TaxID=208480 RepID=A0A1Q5Q3B2_9ACTO|nr:WYL domain-containing protein [Bowdeniella nasicola]OKL54287.1 hypothetical protein BSZ39_04795 [Bowdeniella nasicola]